MKRSDIVNKQEILNNANNGLDIYEKELNIINKSGNKVALCCFHNEKTPSLNIFPEGTFKCFGCGESGDIFSFIMKKYGLSFPDAAKYIRNSSNFTSLSVKNADNVVKKQQRKETIIEFADKPFCKKGHQYWNSFCLSEDFLRKDNIFQVKVYTINDKMIKIPDYQQVFAYYAPDIDRVKLLTIGEKVKNKWISNIDTKYLWYYHLYKEPVKDLFVVKSVKDREVLSLLGYKAIALQNESATTFLKSNIKEINKICENPIIVMGSDTQGFQTSVDITKATGYRWFNTKKYMLKFGVNDPASLCKEFSLEILDNQIKKDLKKWKN